MRMMEYWFCTCSVTSVVAGMNVESMVTVHVDMSITVFWPMDWITWRFTSSPVVESSSSTVV